MKVLVVLNQDRAEHVRVLVRLHTKKLRKQVLSLLGDERKREAFELVSSKARFEMYVPPDEHLPIQPELTLFQDPYG